MNVTQSISQPMTNPARIILRRAVCGNIGVHKRSVQYHNFGSFVSCLAITACYSCNSKHKIGDLIFSTCDFLIKVAPAQTYVRFASTFALMGSECETPALLTIDGPLLYVKITHILTSLGAFRRIYKPS